MIEEECRLLSWGSLLLLLFVLDLCYALGEEGVATIIDGRKTVRECPPYERRRMPPLSWGSLPFLFLVLDICNALGKGRVATITDGRNIREGVPTIYVR